MAVETPNDQYLTHAPRWQRVRDAIGGKDEFTERATDYLPDPSAPGTDATQAANRYSKYFLRAVWLAATAQTSTGLIGSLFREDPSVEAPGDFIVEDINGGGLSAVQFAKRLGKEMLDIGRVGVLADYPPTEGETSLAQSVRPYAATYPAESIISWDDAMVGGVSKLTRVVLKEGETVNVDEFATEEQTIYRVLRLQDGVYTQQVYRPVEVTETTGGFINRQTTTRIEYQPDEELITPRTRSGATIDHIPFHFGGATNNDAIIDASPMLPLADINFAHFRNSADHEENLFQVGQATPHVSGLRTRGDDANVYLGVGAVIETEIGGSAELLQINENQALALELDRKRDMMIAMGARLIVNAGQNETAEAARIKHGSEVSVIQSLANNVDDLMEKVMGELAAFEGLTGDITFETNKQFFEQPLDLNVARGMIEMMNSDLPYTKRDAFDAMKKKGWVAASRDFDAVVDEKEENPPTGLIPPASVVNNESE